MVLIIFPSKIYCTLNANIEGDDITCKDIWKWKNQQETPKEVILLKYTSLYKWI